MKVRLFAASIGLSALMTQATAAAEIHAFVTGAARSAYETIAPQFERATGHKLVSQFELPPTLIKKIDADEPFDVIILSYDVEGLIKQGKVQTGSRVDLVKSLIGMAVTAGAAKPDISSLAALKRTLLAAKSIAYSDSASGVYLSTELFPKLGIADQIRGKSKMIEADPVGESVARGESEIGFQQISELRPVKGIDIVGTLPPGAQRVTIFAAGIPATSKHPAEAKALIKWLASPATYPAIKESGLESVSH